MKFDGNDIVNIDHKVCKYHIWYPNEFRVLSKEMRIAVAKKQIKNEGKFAQSSRFGFTFDPQFAP